jgi:uncharacterized protein (TIGR02266 family)
MKHPVIHFEIGGRDVARASAFYQALFGWRSNSGVIDTGTIEGIRGHFTALGHEPHSYVTVYVEVEDLEGTLAQVEKLGGKRLVGPVEIPTGWFAWFQDLDGNTMGILRPRRAHGFTVKHDAASLLAQLSMLDQSRLMRVPTDARPDSGAVVEITLEVGDRPPLQITGEVKQHLDDGFLARVDLGPDEREALDEALRWATGSQREVRSEPRFPTVFPVTLKGDDPSVARYVKNLSRRGAFIRTKKIPALGSIVTVALRLPDGGEPVEADARVVRVVTEEAAQRTGGIEGIGVRFEALSLRLQARLDALLAAIEGRAGKLAIVADDDVLIRTMVSNLLEGQGIRVMQAASGAEVLDLLGKHADQLTLVVMDLTMPGHDGLELVGELTERIKPRTIPVVVLTGGGPAAARAAIDRGAKHAILKGATGEDILAGIESAMSGT